MMIRHVLLAGTVLWAAAAAAAPSPPYYSIQLATMSNREAAVGELARVTGLPAARIEKRGPYFAVRAGAWPTRREAKLALPAARALGYQDVAVLRITSAVPWLNASPGAAPQAAVSGAAPVPAMPPARSAEPAKVANRPASLEIPPPERDFRAAAKALDWQVRNLVETKGLARRDGYVYTFDLAALMLYAARRGDRVLYDRLRAAAKPLVWNQTKDPFTKGFVLWRHRQGQAPEVSGASEALHLARALWTGAEAFGHGADRELALTILDGYGQHVYELGGDWLVRKYYAFGGKVFANLSVIGAYLPDFLARVEQRRKGRAAGPTLSERSYGILERAVSETGLLYPVIQPEINLTYPGLDLDVYAPNNVLPAADSCEAAAAAVQGRPRIARGVLDFIRDRDRRDRTGYPYAYFDAATGDRIRRQVVGAATLACLAQVATVLDDRKVLDWVRPLLLAEIKSLAAVPAVQEATLFTAGPLLLAAEAMGAFR